MRHNSLERFWLALSGSELPDAVHFTLTGLPVIVDAGDFHIALHWDLLFKSRCNQRFSSMCTSSNRRLALLYCALSAMSCSQAQSLMLNIFWVASCGQAVPKWGQRLPFSCAVPGYRVSAPWWQRQKHDAMCYTDAGFSCHDMLPQLVSNSSGATAECVANPLWYSHTGYC